MSVIVRTKEFKFFSYTLHFVIFSLCYYTIIALMMFMDYNCTPLLCFDKKKLLLKAILVDTALSVTVTLT